MFSLLKYVLNDLSELKNFQAIKATTIKVKPFE